MIATVIWWIIRTGLRRLHKATDPGDLVIKWIITLATFMFWIYLGVKAGGVGDYGSAFLVAGVAAGTGILLAIIWAPHIAEFVSNPIERLYMGSDDVAELKPLYSMATAYRKRGNYVKAIEEIHRQLANFPTDYEGWMMLAEVLAEDVKDLEGASQTIDRLLAFPNQPIKNISYALGRLADWRLRYEQDIDGARSAFQRIIDLAPNTVEAQFAEQRIAHLVSPEDLANQHDPRVIGLKRFDDRIGLMGRVIEPAPETPAADKAQSIVAHLRQFPLDNEAREKLALLYADEFKRLDMATIELEELIGRPNQMQKNVAHWLNMLADFQMRLAGDIAGGRATLERIITLFPGSAVANNANVRISQLRLELNQRSQQRTIKLGHYEQNIGLRKMNSSGAVEST